MATQKQTGSGSRPVSESLQEYGRGVAGGLIFTLPLLYTGEVWRAGLALHPWRLVGGVVATCVLLLGYNRYAGLREDASFAEVLIDSIEEFGIGILLAAIALWLLGRFEPGNNTEATIGMITLSGMLAAIGVSVGTAQLGGSSNSGEKGHEDKPRGAPRLREQCVLGGCGAVLVATNIAPTREVSIIAAGLAGGKLILLVLVSLGLAAVICFYSDFTGSARDKTPVGRTVLAETLLTYLVGLCISGGLLWFFGRFDGESLLTCIGRVVVLGAAAALGASAGKLLLQHG